MQSLKSILKSEPLKKIKGLKKDQLVILLLFGILLVVIAIPTEPGKSSDTKSKQEETEEAQTGKSGNETVLPEDTYVRQQEERLKEVLQKVEGVGDVEVMITLQSSSEKVVEKDTPSTRQTVEESDSAGGSRTTLEESWTEETIYQEEDGSRIPYVVKELEPKTEGVIVIAEGGGNAEVKQNILEAVQALFPVEAHKIKIMKMEGSK